MRRAIVTTVIDKEGELMGENSLPRMQDYAKKVNAKMVVIRKRLPGYDFIAMSRFYIERHLPIYPEGMFYLDIDTLISRDTPDIFKIAPQTGVSVVMDSKDEKYDEPRWGKYVRAAAALAETTEWKSYFNSGVVMIRQDCKMLFTNPDYKVIMPWFPDQTIMNLNCHRFNIPVHFLDKKWNLFTLNGGNEKTWPNCYVAHFAGIEPQTRIQLMHYINQQMP
jgi:lipopolysaccharide biosynthesis glycosyltransferase